MERTTPRAWTGLLVGLLLAVPLTAIAYFANQFFRLPFPPFDIFDGVTRVLPGPIVTFGIDLMIDTLRALRVSVVDTAKTAEQLMAVGMFILGGTVAGAVFFAVLRWRRVRRAVRAGLLAGLVMAAFFVALAVVIGQTQTPLILQALWLLALMLGWGAALGLIADRLTRLAPVPSSGDTVTVRQIGRREFLIQSGIAAATVTVVGAGLALNERRRIRATVADGSTGSTTLAGSLPNAGDPVEPVSGTRPEYTPLDDFYLVFIRTEPSVVSGDSWQLPITGLVANPARLTLDNLRNDYEPMDQYVTLSCISGRVGTRFIGTTLWTGASLQDVLAGVGVQPEARYLRIYCADGFHETVDLDLIAGDRRVMLTYAWDGRPLSTDHGFPLRIYIPDRYGMKQPRWITNIEVTDEYTDGYWVERGWDEDAIMQTTSVIDTVATDAVIGTGDQQRVPIGGIAHAGARGISKVEVRVDGGEWADAELRSPLSDLTWVIWRYEWSFEAGNHVFEVRCAEADGTPQIEVARSSRPSGARGIHSLTESI